MTHKDRKRQKIFIVGAFINFLPIHCQDLAQAVHAAERFLCDNEPHMNEKTKGHTEKTKFRQNKQYELETWKT